MNRLLCLSLAALAVLASSCATTPTDNAEASASSVDETRAWLRDFGAKYEYDVAYMETLLDLSPAAYEAFAAGMSMAEKLAHLPVDAHYVGAISALLADDCGQCTQLNLRIAVEAGVDRAILKQLLKERTTSCRGSSTACLRRPSSRLESRWGDTESPRRWRM